jgi:hemolysin III
MVKMTGIFKMKEPVNTLTHFVPFLAAIAGLIVIIVKTMGDPAKLITMTIYVSSVILLFGTSSFYHWLKVSPKIELLLRKLDHMAIYLLIAGSYTPVLYYGLHGMWRGVMLTLIWILAVIGIILKIWFINAPRKLSTALYVFLGWIAVVPFYQLIHTLSLGAIVLLVFGGISYTVGAVIYGTKRLNFFPEKFGFHEIFHLFVALGGLLHFLMMVIYILPL